MQPSRAYHLHHLFLRTQTRQRWTCLRRCNQGSVLHHKRSILLGPVHSALHVARTSPSLAPLARRRWNLRGPTSTSSSRFVVVHCRWAVRCRPVSMASLSRMGQDLLTLGHRETQPPSVHSSYRGSSLQLSSITSLDSPTHILSSSAGIISDLSPVPHLKPHIV